MTTTPLLTRDAAPRATRRDWAGLAVLMLPVLLISIDTTVLNFALPQIAQVLSPSAAQQLWLIDAYPLVLATLLVTMGTVGDRVGRRRILLVGATGFAGVSALAAFAPTAELLLLARVGLGIFGATLMPATLSLLRSMFLDRTQRRLAIAIWATAFSVGSALGPVVGGVLLAHFHWGAVFLVAVPILVPLLVLGPFLIRESRDPAPGQIDVVGMALSMVALGGIAWAVKHVAVDGVDAVALAVLVAAVLAGAGFVRRMRRAVDPMLDVHLFAVPAFSGALAVNLLSIVALTGFLFFVTQHLQLVEGMPALEASLVLVPGVVAMIAAGLLVVRVVRHVRPALAVVGGLSFSFAAYALLAASGATITVPHIALAFALLGLGIGAAETISNDQILTAVPPAKAGAASAVSETAYEFGAVLGTTVLGGLLTAVYRSSLVIPAGTDPGSATAARETLGGAVAAAERTGDPALLEAARTAFDAGVGVTSTAGAVLVAAAALTAWVTLRHAER
ncbi:MFS transporter [Serinicoccus kebangsaanensis]|uniref:MFS transporter n=1 Tax=Serinicoccus kebangsaanensis TaxID=2602069 RepID=UPI001EE219A6|nr:MFS transporter [Serinicoccus kebangsaanensis]